MADAKKTEAPAAGEAPKKSKKLLVIILAAVLVLVLGGGAALFLLKKSHPADEEADEGDEPPAKTAKTKKKKDTKQTPPVFTKLEPFVVKLQAEQQEAYVQAVPELKLLEAATADQIKNFMPEIRHKVLLILASKKASELSNPQGMQILANQIRESINATLTDTPPDPAAERLDANEEGPVLAVFFSSLIVQ